MKMKIKITASFKTNANKIKQTRHIFTHDDKIILGYLWEKKCVYHLRITCCNKNDLSLIWEKDFEGLFYKGYSTPNYTIWYGNHIICLDNATGDVVWKKEKIYCICSNIQNDRIICIKRSLINDNDNEIQCLNAIDGSVIWKKAVEECISTFAILENDRAYYIQADKYMYCIDAKTGQKIWSSDDFSYNGTLFEDFIVQSKSSSLLFYSKENGQQIASYEVCPEREGKTTINFDRGSATFYNSTYSHVEKINIYGSNRIYVYTISGTVYALDITKEKNLCGKTDIKVKEAWHYDAEHLDLLEFYSPECPIKICEQINEQYVIVGEDTKKVKFLDALSGESITCIKPKFKEVLEKILIEDDSIYFMCQKGWVYKGHFEF